MDAGVAKDAEGRQEVGSAHGSGHPARPVALLEACAYAVIAVLLVLCAFVDGRVQLVVCEIVAQAVLFFGMVFWPMRGTVVDRVIGVVGGEAMIFGTQAVLVGMLPRATRPFGFGWSGQTGFGMVAASLLLHVCTVWATGAMVVLTAFVIVGFLHQMLRRERTDMVLSLSQSLMVNVGMLASSGWMFVPVLFRYLHIHESGFVGPAAAYAGTVVGVVLVVAIALIAAISAVSLRWYRDFEPVPGGMRQSEAERNVTVWQRYSWAGIGLSAVMLSGLVVYLAAVALLFVVG
ncbi:hypothetical protein PT282_01220 [Bifidobacterium sp. ESL0763]|uniref:hypothetical protein n=1 Tax=Bifidobacterium sp. ESL0763 TaxID=2983227 RepID=UPI0023F84002|nr:hypothetical protein [Bifidobacterium sp. ESL0763]MDF7663303.1 hypothetical protein [Bifidobacterium sp. ESL0763]